MFTLNAHARKKTARPAVSALISGVGSGVAPGARAPPCWIVLESFHKRETCFAGIIFPAWSGGPRLAEPPREIEKAWLREAKASVGACAWSCHITKYGSTLYIGMGEVLANYACTFEISDLHFHFQ